MRQYDLYFVVPTQTAYILDQDDNLVQLANDLLPYIRYRETINLSIQYLNTPVTTDVYLGFVGHTIASTGAVDNNWTHFYAGTLVDATLSGAITSVEVSGVSSSFTPSSTGRITLDNGSDDPETIAYTAVVASGSNWVFTVSTTLTYSYTAGDTVNVKENCAIKTTTVDQTDKDTGLFILTLSADNEDYYNKIIGSASIENCLFEHKVTEAGDMVFASQFSFLCLNIVDDDGAIPPPQDGDYYTASECDSLFVPLYIDTQDTLTDDSANYISLGLASAYRVFVIEFTIDDGTNYYSGTMRVLHDGSNVYIAGPYNALGTGSPPYFPAVSFSVEYNSGAPRLVITLTSHGTDIEMVYDIIHRHAVSA